MLDNAVRLLSGNIHGSLHGGEGGPVTLNYKCMSMIWSQILVIGLGTVTDLVIAKLGHLLRYIYLVTD